MSQPAAKINADHPASPQTWRSLQNGSIECRLCPRFCVIKKGNRGFCFVRQNHGGKMVLTAYGRSSGLCIDPIEKKPLYHFYPGSEILSFGTAGCNLGCRFCQNWTLSRSRQMVGMSESASPEHIARTAIGKNCRSVAFTYNDPVIFLEYALAVAAACRDGGVKTVAVTAGYLSDEGRPLFFSGMDAANVDLKAFSENFYQKYCSGHLQPVLDTLKYLVHNTSVWLEITNLLIPGVNDAKNELEAMTNWIAGELGPDIPLHFSAFHPAHKMDGVSRTSVRTLMIAREIALSQGLRYVYTGNISDTQTAGTWCPQCSKLLIERDWHRISANFLHGSSCSFCRHRIPGHF